MKGETMPNDVLLKIEDLHVEFQNKKKGKPLAAVDGVDIAIPEGRIVGLVGESGCGKSMTAMAVMGLLSRPSRASQGKILLGETDLLALPAKEVRKITGDRISIIFQEPMTSLNPLITVGKQVDEVLRIHANIAPQEAREKTIEMFRAVGIPEPEKRYHSYPYELSGGLRQRIMIAMAMICKPDLLIADEPTTALDVTIEAQILRLMKELQQETKMSVLLITHNMGVVAQACDEVYVMYLGKVMEYAEVHELFQHPTHPYTLGLMHSLPGTARHGEPLYNIPGVVPPLSCLPEGCRFCTRCERVQERCFKEQPGLYDVGQGHMVRCFLYEKGGEANG